MATAAERRAAGLPERVRQAGGVVFRRRPGGVEVLVVSPRESPGEWILPKGHVELGEDTVSAALREVREETGVLGAAVAVLEPPLRFRSNDEDVEVRYALVQALDDGAPQEERVRRWLPAEAAMRELTHEDARALLRRALALLDPPAAREDRFAQLLLEEHGHLGDSLIANEEDGERRATFFVSLATGIGAVLTFLGPGAQGPVLVAALAAVAVLGLLAFARIARRNAQSDEYKRLMARVRRQFLEGPRDPRHSVLPWDPFAPEDRRRAWRSLATGGWLGYLAVVEALVVGALLASALVATDLRPGSWDWRLFAGAALAAFLGLMLGADVYYAWKARSRS